MKHIFSNEKIDTAPATSDELELIAFLKSEREETLAWVAEDPKNRFATLPIYEIEFLRERRYTSIPVYLRKQKELSYYEEYKSVYGVKPRWVQFDFLTDAELDGMLEHLAEEAKEQQIYEAARNADELKKETELCERFKVDTETLVRWGVLEAWTPWRSGEKWMRLDRDLFNLEVA